MFLTCFFESSCVVSVENLLDRIDLHTRQNATGMSVAVRWRGELVYAEGFGLADVENGVEVTPETVFRIGSVTKQFTAVLIVFEAGKSRGDFVDLVFFLEGHAIFFVDDYWLFLVSTKRQWWPAVSSAVVVGWL